MTTFVEYKLDDNTTILIETDEPPKGGTTKISRKDSLGNVIETATQTFSEAFAKVKSSATIIRQHLADLKADEIEVTFGLKATGDFGNFAIGKVGAEANYMVTLKWSNEQKANKDEQT